MKTFVVILLSFWQAVVMAQTITGKVSDAENGAPLGGVTVYISNSSRATTTDAKGQFSIEGFNSSYELIISMVGYQIVSIPSTNIGKTPLDIRLQPKENTLDPVAVQSYEKDGWKKWGRLFIQQFIGALPYSNQCIIKNKEAVKFRYSRKNNQLEAVAFEPLIIVNDYLGYRIRYDLQYFISDFKTHYTFYAGYPVFSNISSKAQYLRVRNSRREDVYASSLLHFMRALYNGRLDAEGFQVRNMKKLPNLEKKRVDSIYKANTYISLLADGRKMVMNKTEQIFPRDSLNYYSVVRRQPDILNVLDDRLLSSKDLSVSTDSIGKTFAIKDYLHIIYPSKWELPEYYTGKIGVYADSCITSVISLLDTDTIQVFYNGQYIPATSVLTEQYWGWSEKISSMLPFDYKMGSIKK
ncbi:MAG: carboxypeptidase-like regulatory domain-containing protein [Chitinophagaceae bacterium]